MDEQLPPEHVIRVYPPWRDAEPVTECGLPVDDNALSNEDFHRKTREYGEGRARYLFCDHCWSRAHRYGQNKQPRSWGHDPVAVVIADLTRSNIPEDHERHTRELRAIAMLVEAHRGEFDATMAGLADTSDLASRRNAARQKGPNTRSFPP